MSSFWLTKELDSVFVENPAASLADGENKLLVDSALTDESKPELAEGPSLELADNLEPVVSVDLESNAVESPESELEDGPETDFAETTESEDDDGVPDVDGLIGFGLIDINPSCWSIVWEKPSGPAW